MSGVRSRRHTGSRWATPSGSRWATVDTLPVSRGFGDDALAYFTERLDPGPTRAALAATVRRAKRNKAFAAGRWIGIAIDGTGAGRCQGAGCALCRPVRDATAQILGYRPY